MFRRLSSWIAVTLPLLATAAEPTFADPLPPKAAERSAAAAPEARDNPEAKFHAAPKPLPAGAVTGDWPSFLGPTHNMVSTETKLLRDFATGGPQLVWEMKKGEGYAAPAILGDRLILFHRVDDHEVVECLRPTDGKRYWQFRYPTAYRDRYGYNHGPRASPVIGDDRVFTYGAEGRLHCLDLKTGQLLWRRSLLSEFEIEPNFFGVGATPLIEGDKLIVNVGAPAGPCVAAFDLRSGKMIWGAAAEGWGASYASPVPTTMHGRRRVFVFAGGESKPATGGLIGLDPENGRVDFTFPWRSKRVESVNASSPVILGNQVFVSECYGTGSALVEVQPDATVKLVWKNSRFGTHFMTAIPKDGFLYGVDGHGPQDAELVCVDLKSGTERWRTQPTWQEKVDAKNGSRDMNVAIFRGSFLMVDGRTLCLGEYGHLLWLDLSPEGYRERSRTWLFQATETWTPPVLSRGLLYVCQNSRAAFGNDPQRLLCYDLRAAE